MTEKMLKDCTVRIEAYNEIDTGNEIGTGFFINKNRIVTCCHVLGNSKDIQIFWKGNQYRATVLDRNEENDIAVLEAYINNEQFIEIDKKIESENEFYCYGFPISDEINGEPLSFLLESNELTENGLYKFKNGNFEGGYSGSAILNKNTNKVCAIVKRTRDKYTDLGGYGIPIIKLELLDYEEKTLDGKLYSSIPNLPSEYLPREEDMKEIKKILLNNNNHNTGISEKFGLCGMGGIGKSIFSIAIGHDKEVKRYFKDGIYFIKLGQNPDIQESQETLLYRLGIKNENFTEKIMKEKIRDFFVNKQALLIIDDIWNSKDLNYFEVKSNSKILITTRQKNIITAIGAIEHSIDLLNKKQSFFLLEKKVGNIIVANDLKLLAEEIIDECGYLPLAINIMGAILQDNVDDWDDILEDLKDSRLDVIKFDEMQNEQHQSLYQVIELSVKYLEKKDRQRYLSLSILDFKDIPKETLKNYWDKDFRKSISKLISASLIFKENDIEGKTIYYTHNLQADYIESCDKNKKKKYKKFIDIYKKKYSKDWYKISIDDKYFYKEYLKICKYIDNESLAKEISKNILYKQNQLGLPEIKKIIALLKLDEKKVGEKLSEITKNSMVLIWIQNPKSLHKTSEILAPNYLKQDIQNLDDNLILKYLDVLGKKSIDVKEFSERYLEEINIENIDKDIALKCLNILNENQIKCNKFSEKYIEYLINNIQNIDNRLVTKILKILNEELEIIVNFAKVYINQDLDLLDDNVSYRCLHILSKNSEEIIMFAKKYIEKGIDTLSNTIAIKCLEILGKETREAQEFAEKYINRDEVDPYLLNSCLSFLSPDNEKRKIFAENVLKSKTNKGKPKLHLYISSIQAQILYTEINNRVLREENALKVLYFLKKKIIKRDVKFFIDNRVLYNASLLVFKEKPYKIKDFSLSLLDNWEEEIKFRITKSKHKYYHFHIITALENPKIEKKCIQIARMILQKDNELNELAIKNIDKKHFFMSYRLDDTIHKLIKKDILNNRYNFKETKKILNLLEFSFKIRESFRNMNSDIKYGNGSGNGRYIQAINILSFFAKVHNDLSVAIKYKKKVILMMERELIEKYNEDWEKKIKINKLELIEMKQV